MGRLISKHFEYSGKKLMEYSRHLDLPNHSDIKGSAREGLINIFLKDNLPSVVDFGTGEIIDSNDNRSGQVDVIIQSRFSPKLNLFESFNLSLADTVLAAIEVKSNLTTSKDWEKDSHLKSALGNIQKIKSLNRKHFIRGDMGEGEIILNNTPCFIFAYSGPKSDTLKNLLNDYGSQNGLKQDDYWPEVITVLDRGYYLIKNDGWFIKKFDSRYNCSTNIVGPECLYGMFVYICKIIEAWHFTRTPTPFQDYFKEL